MTVTVEYHTFRGLDSTCKRGTIASDDYCGGRTLTTFLDSIAAEPKAETSPLSAGAVLTEVSGTSEDARARAAALAMDSQREVVPVRVFEQGRRTMLDGVLPIRVLVRVLEHNAVPKGATAGKALTALNRPVVPQHVRAIVTYLRQALESGSPYIIPALTLNSTDRIEVVIPSGNYRPITGYAVFPDEAAVHITDGQHRFLAIREVVGELRGTHAGAQFMRAGIPVMITIESELAQVHQDFADAGKTKPLPLSLLAVYDVRQPANAAVMKIAERVPLLKDRIDATSTTLSVNSPFIFLVNQIRQFVKSSLTGNPSMQEPTFAIHARNALSHDEARERWTSSRVAFLKVMTEIIEDWRELAALPAPGGADAAEVLARTKAIRGRRRVSMSAACLTTLGLVSYDVLMNVTSSPVVQAKLESELRTTLKPLEKVDWNRSADIWAGNLVVDGTILNRTAVVKGAHKALMSVLDSA